MDLTLSPEGAWSVQDRSGGLCDGAVSSRDAASWSSCHWERPLWKQTVRHGPGPHVELSQSPTPPPTEHHNEIYPLKPPALETLAEAGRQSHHLSFQRAASPKCVTHVIYTLTRDWNYTGNTLAPCFVVTGPRGRGEGTGRTEATRHGTSGLCRTRRRRLVPENWSLFLSS